MAEAPRQALLSVASVLLAQRVAALGVPTTTEQRQAALVAIEHELVEQLARRREGGERRSNPASLLQVARLLVFGDLAMQQVGALLTDGGAS